MQQMAMRCVYIDCHANFLSQSVNCHINFVGASSTARTCETWMLDYKILTFSQVLCNKVLIETSMKLTNLALLSCLGACGDAHS